MADAPLQPMLDYDAFSRTKLERDPFPYLFVPHFVRPEAFDTLEAEFPPVDRPGSFPPDEVPGGPRFAALLEELEGPGFRALVEEKFGLDLGGRPTMVTVRGRIALKNGDIHRDSETKLVTVLIYFNRRWEAPGGRLRILRSATDLEDSVAEIPPVAGNLVAFQVTENSWHGHHPAEGPRKAIQLNWVTDEGVVRRELRRHRLSARVKSLSGLFRGGHRQATG